MLAILAWSVVHALPIAYEGSTSLAVAGGALVGGGRGNYEVLTPQLVLAHELGVFVEVAVPIARVEYEGSSTVGPGDLGAVVGWRSRGLSLGVATMWPTGDPHRGLGTGHLMIAPRFDARLAVDRVMLVVTTLLRGALPLGEHGHHNRQSLIAPHDLLDVMTTARLGIAPAPWLELWGVAVPVAPLIAHPTMSPGARVSLGAEVAVRAEHFRAALSAVIPVTENRTSSWQLGLNVAVGDAVPALGCH